jgi:hypothetical protein
MNKKPYRTTYRPRKPRNSVFAKWLDAKGAPLVSELARRLKVTTAVVYNYRAGHFKPGRERASLIEAISGGLVTVGSWDDRKNKQP